MRLVLSFVLAVLSTTPAGANAEGCAFDTNNLKKTGDYFLVPKPEGFDVLKVDAKEVFESLVSKRATSFACQLSKIEGARDDVGLFHASFRDWVCVNTKTQVAWNPREFRYMSRSGEPMKTWQGSPDLAARDTDFVVLVNDGVKHWFSVGGWQPGVLDRSIQRSEATRRNGEYYDNSRGAYRHRFQGDCSKSDQLLLYSVTELFYRPGLRNSGSPDARIPLILVARESEGPYTVAAQSETKSPAF